MKTIRNLIITATITVSAFIAAPVAHAQGSVDLFGAPRTIVATAPTLLAANALLTTNGPIDTHGFLGIAKLDIFSLTNAGGTLTATVETSTDSTNWTAIANYAKAISTSVTYTNLYYGGTNLTASDTYLLPGTLTTPTANSAGWGTVYIAPSAFTNSGALTITASGIYEIGYNIADQPRYFHIVWSATGAATNGGTAVGAILTGRRGGEVK